jgi:hypothetical protein
LVQQLSPGPQLLSQVSLEPLVRRASLELAVLLAFLERQEPPASQVQVVRLERRGSQVSQVHLDSLEQTQVLQELLVLQDSVVRQELLDSLERQELLDFQEPPERQGSLESQELLVSPVRPLLSVPIALVRVSSGTILQA